MAGFGQRLQNRFVKRRIIVRYEKKAALVRDETAVAIREMQPADGAALVALRRGNHAAADRFQKRLSSASWTGVLAVEKATGRVVGCQWALVSFRSTVWYDCLPVPPGSALSVDHYVAPEFRGRGINAQMTQKLLPLLSARDIGSVVSVIEARNRASLRSAFHCGHRQATNILLKWFGKNVVSVVIGRGCPRIYPVRRQRPI